MPNVEQIIHHVRSIRISCEDYEHKEATSSASTSFRTISMTATTDDGVELVLRAFTDDMHLVPEFDEE